MPMDVFKIVDLATAVLNLIFNGVMMWYTITNDSEHKKK